MKREHLVPIKQAEKRGMGVTFDAAGYINSAHLPAPFLIDRLLDRRVIGYDHHFYGVQLMTMRKMFLDPVRARVGMLRVQSDEGAAPEKPVPMEDADYLKVLRAMHNNRWREIVRGVCDEAADPGLADRYGRAGHDVGLAFDQLCEAVLALWEEKKAGAGADDRFR